MKAVPHQFSRSAEISHKSLTFIPASQQIKPLRDVLIVEVLDAELSKTVTVVNELKPVRGIVQAVGPGHYPNVYLDKNGEKLPDHRRKDRKQIAAGTHFVPTTVKAGDVVNLGGLDIKGYAFQDLTWGDKYCVVCREADVALIEEAA